MTQRFSGFFKVVPPQPTVTTMSDSQNIGDQGTYANYTWYQRLVQGAASRVTRYREYDLMDNDIEISRSLDTIAEEMTGSDPNSDMPLKLNIHQDKGESIPSSGVVALRAALRYWNDIHGWDTKLFGVCRNTVKYGDAFFIRRDNDTWEYTAAKNVVSAIVDDRDMTNIVGWQIKQETKSPNSPYNQSNHQFGQNSNEAVDTFTADQVIRFTLNDEMSESAPFGESILRAVYRAYKQKELLEDAIIIYRIQRAPERRVFHVDVGKLPPHRVKPYLESFKNEIRQRKIPTYGGGTNQVDSVYNPQQMSEDFFFAARADGGGNKVETLPGGQGLGELSDLEYFQWKVLRGLRIPLSFMREGQEGAMASDGKTGVAYIQELRFALYIKRLATHISSVLDKEFKRFVRMAGITVDPTLYTISLNEPENFGKYRQQQMDTDLLNTYQLASGIEHMSKRFAQRRFLQMSEEDIAINFRMRCEELGLNPDDQSKAMENMRAVYGPPPGGDGMMGDGGMGGGMMAGTMGGPGFSDPMMGDGGMDGGMGGGMDGTPPAAGVEQSPAPQ